MVESLVGVTTLRGREAGLAHTPREQPIERQLCGQEGIFPPRGGLALVPRGVSPSSAALSRAPCQGSSGPFWVSDCLLLLPHQDTTGALGLWSGGIFHPLGQVGTGPQRFYSFLCSIEQSPLPGLLWAILE